MQPKLTIQQQLQLKLPQKNDSVSVNPKGGKQCRTRSSRNIACSKNQENKTNTNVTNESRSLSKVQWTKEFMEKIRRSNERHKNEKKTNTDNTSSNSQFQRQPEDQIHDQMLRGDGITAIIDAVPDEELDYEDDLSIEEDVQVLVVEEEDDFEPDGDCPAETVQHGQPSTSRQGAEMDKNAELNKLLVSQPEEQLMDNLVLQRMMKKFFNEQFKNMQPDNLKVQGKNQGRSRSMEQRKVKDKSKEVEIKSPSDTTIYAPALQKRMELNNDFNPLRGMRNVHIGNDNNQTNNFASDEFCSRPNSKQVVVAVNTGKQNNGTYPELNEITDFVESIRLDQHPGDADGIAGMRRHSDVVAAAELEQAHRCAEKTIIEAEKF